MQKPGLVVLLALAGCTHWVETRTPLPQVLEVVPPPRRRLATRAGESLVMVGARLRGDSLTGSVERQSGGEAAMSALLGTTFKHHVPGTLAVQDVVRIDVRRPDPIANAALAVGIGVGLVAVVVIASDPWFSGSNLRLFHIAF